LKYSIQCIPVVKILALTRGIHAPRPYGQLAGVQFCYPAELPLTLNKLKRFETGSIKNQI
jgi:hypothetical protein